MKIILKKYDDDHPMIFNMIRGVKTCQYYLHVICHKNKRNFI